MTFEEALKLAEFERGQFDSGEVASARDCGDRWVFYYAADIGKVGTAPAFVFKETGAFEYVDFTSENLEIMRNGKDIPLTGNFDAVGRANDKS